MLMSRRAGTEWAVGWGEADGRSSAGVCQQAGSRQRGAGKRHRRRSQPTLNTWPPVADSGVLGVHGRRRQGNRLPYSVVYCYRVIVELSFPSVLWHCWFINMKSIWPVESWMLVSWWCPSVLWHCWFIDRKSIWPVESWMLVSWWWLFEWSFAPPPSSLASIKSRMETFCYLLTQVHLEMAINMEGERKRDKILSCPFTGLFLWWHSFHLVSQRC